MTVSIKLYSGKAIRFEKIKEQMTRELGYTPSNSEVVGLLMARNDLGLPTYTGSAE